MLNFAIMKKTVFILFFLLIFIVDSYSQCAMCKAVVESNMENGDNIGAGLNDGILYLMAMPYISLAVVAFLWSRHNLRS